MTFSFPANKNAELSNNKELISAHLPQEDTSLLDDTDAEKSFSTRKKSEESTNSHNSIIDAPNIKDNKIKCVICGEDCDPLDYDSHIGKHYRSRYSTYKQININN